jgi:hypothetical protein
VSRTAICLTLALLLGGCRDDAEQPGARHPDTIAPIGTGTELLLTRERLALIEGWIHASIARGGPVPASLDDVRPPEVDAARYAPLERFLRDGWGRAIEYEYTPGTRSFELRSPGEDGVPGTGDDVSTVSRSTPSTTSALTPESR